MSRRRRWVLPFILSAAMVLLAVSAAGFQRYRIQQLFRQSLQALRDGDTQSAVHLADSLLARTPHDLRTVRLAAMAHRDAGNSETAGRLFLRLGDGQQAAREELMKAVEESMTAGNLQHAVSLLNLVLSEFPAFVDANRRLAAIMNTTGQRWQAASEHLAGVKQLQFSIEELLLLGNPDEPWIDRRVPAPTDNSSSADPLALLATAYQMLTSDRHAEAVDMLRTVIRRQPDLVAAHAMLGTALLELQRYEEMIHWHQSLPMTADQHSEIWFVRALWAQATNQNEAAVRCYWETIRRAPEKRRAHFQLGQLLSQTGRSEQAQPFLERAAQLTQLHDLLRPVYAKGADTARIKDIAERLEQLGRFWEARAWNLAATRFAPADQGAVLSASRLRKQLTSDSLPQTLAEFNPAVSPAVNGEFSQLPLPLWNWQPTELRVDRHAVHTVDFKDIAPSVGIHFQYFNSDDPATEGKRMFETTGGGVAVLDFEGKGRHGLYFTQGCQWPPADQPGEFRDQLYRNSGNGSFSECSEAAGLLDVDFSQGVAVGDFDNDGFPDLYVGNIGRNRLLQNNGDGTFQNVSLHSGITGDHWTTSCVLADLDGDSLPDIYDANYLTGQEAFELICGTEYRRTCSPSTFDPALQQLWRNCGDGSWEALRMDTNGQELHSKGLGVVAASLSGTQYLDLFVANDGEANSYLRQQTSASGHRMILQELAVLSGLAFDRDGRPQACMGIAAEDANGDGLLDFFVTNYYEESNTLYLQQPGGLFVDATREAGLREPSLRMLGFGTQFLDGDLDGLPDLVVANGHVDDFSYDGKAFRMRPQYFQNTGSGRFREIRPEQPDSYLTQEHLGRGMARIDWNRDGREDFAVSHLDTPAALVCNQTVPVGNCLSFRLIGVNCSRDAIGTTVTVTAGDTRRTRQLTAGDGYQASNERILIFGIGTSESVRDVSIAWRSGHTQQLPDLPAGYEYLVVEGRPPLPVPLEKPDDQTYALSGSVGRLATDETSGAAR